MSRFVFEAGLRTSAPEVVSPGWSCWTANRSPQRDEPAVGVRHPVKGPCRRAARALLPRAAAPSAASLAR
jgi:hypothetical protein